LPEIEAIYNQKEWDLVNCLVAYADYTAESSSSSGNGSDISSTIAVPCDLVPSIDSFFSYSERWLMSEDQSILSYTYLSTLQLMSNPLVAYIIDRVKGGSDVQAFSDISKTGLMFSRELLQSTRTRRFGESNLQHGFSTNNFLTESGSSSNAFWPAEASLATTFNRSLARGIEELFQNVT
jgi:hypothetical protein